MSRRTAREAALQVLFQVDLSSVELPDAFDHVFTEFGINSAAQQYCRFLVEGAQKHQKQIDEVIQKVSNEWDLKRMANVDRNILRIGLFELLYCADVPNNVVINEAIELGKVYSTAESGKFINGILGHVAKNLDQFPIAPEV